MNPGAGARWASALGSSVLEYTVAPTSSDYDSRDLLVLRDKEAAPGISLSVRLAPQDWRVQAGDIA